MNIPLCLFLFLASTLQRRVPSIHRIYLRSRRGTGKRILSSDINVRAGFKLPAGEITGETQPFDMKGEKQRLSSQSLY